MLQTNKSVIMSAHNSVYNIQKHYSFIEYKEIANNLAIAGKSSGVETQERIDATKINAQRLNRIYKTFEPSAETKRIIGSLKQNWEWIVITESWCGDGAQLIPIITKIAELNNLIQLKFIFRDENETIMNLHLTNGSKSIPKLICLGQNKEYIGEWGPRPSRIIEKAKEFKTTNPNASHEDFIRNLHLLYAQDKGLSFEIEFANLITQWNNIS